MAGIKFERKNNIAPASGPDNGDALSIGHAMKGEVVQLVCRYAENYINATTAPTLTQWEGPYLRIVPRPKDIGLGLEHGFEGNKWRIGDVAQVSGGNISPVNGSGGSCFGGQFDTFFYEVDAISQPPIFLPFDADLYLYSALSGAWLFDIVRWRPGERIPPAGPQLLAQSRRVATTVARSLRVPIGCSEYSVAGYFPTGIVTFDNEESGKAAGLGNSRQADFGLVYSGNGSVNRYPINGTRVMNVTANAAGSATVVFWVQL